MGISKDPGKERRPASWHFEKLKGEGWFNAWIAGPVVGVYVHHMPPSKPCRWIMTDAQIECPLCKVRPRTEWKGYVPLYSDSGKPVVVMIPEAMKGHVEAIGTHEPVRVSRGSGKCDTVAIHKAKWSDRYVSGKTERAYPALIDGWLFVLWGDAVLSEWYHARVIDPGARPAGVEVPELNRVKTGDALPPDEERALTKRVIRDNFKVRPAADPPLIGEALPNLRAKMNGKPH